MPATALRRRWIVLPLVLACCASVGCGAAEYNERTRENSVPFFRHEATLNANLTARTQAGNLSLRLPAGMVELPRPKKDAKGLDPRLPPDSSTDSAAQLPGLVAGYRGKVKASTGTVAGSKPVTATTYVLVLSSDAYKATTQDANGKAIKPLSFEKRALEALALQTGKPIPQQGQVVKAGGEKFYPDVKYDLFEAETYMGGTLMRYQAYFTVLAGTDYALVYLIPAQPDRGERLGERVKLSLETVRARKASAAAGGGPGAPAAGAPAF